MMRVRQDSLSGRGDHLLLAFVAIMGLLALRPEMARAQSANDGFDPNATGEVACIALQADGKIVVGGFFEQIGGQARFHIARLNPDGSLDTSFDPGAGANATVGSLAVQADGKILVGGRFSELRGQPRNHIGRLNPNGSLDTSFNPGANGGFYGASAIVVQPDGRILLGGDFTDLDGQFHPYIGRLNPDGSLDTSFNPGANQFVQAIALQADGKILVGGGFAQLGGQFRNRIGRLNPDGSLDTTFNPLMDGTGWALAVQADGKILVGIFSQLGGQQPNFIHRLNSDGSVDTSFNTAANNEVRAIAVQADGKILLSGIFTQLGGQTRNHIGRLNSNGSLDTSFDPGANNIVWAVAVQPDGKVVVGGDFTQLGGQARNFIGRLYPDGSLDASLIAGANDLVLAIAAQTDGKILLGGRFTQLGGQPRDRIGRLNSDGSLDPSFNPGADDDVNAIAVQADGKILLGGKFKQLGGESRNRIGRLNSDGSLDTAFNPGADSDINAIAAQADGKILLGGNFTHLGGQPRNRIGRLNPDGSFDTDFKLEADNTVLSLAIQADAKILLGGGFTHLGGQTRNGIGRLNSDGSLDLSFNPGANSEVDAIALQADGKILVGGGFTQLGGQPFKRMVRLNSDGSIDPVFHPDPDNTVFTIAVQTDGKILVGGFFSQLNGLVRIGLGRLYPEDAAPDPSFIPGNGGVVAIAMQADGKVLVGGFFTQLGGQPRDNIGRLTNTDAALQTLSVSSDGTAIQWLRTGVGPEVSRVTFEASTNGLNYFLIGSATRIARGWQLTGVSLPRAQNIFIRARGYYSTGFSDGSGSVVESVRNAFLFAPTLVCPCPPGGIISWWPAENNAQDIVSHYDGTLQNGATFATGQVGQAFSLDGIDDAIVVNNNVGLNPTSITVEAWIRPNSVPVGTIKNVVAKWGFDASLDSYLLGLLNTGSGITILGGIGDGATGDPGLSGGAVPLNTWSHIAMTYDAPSGSHRLYLNGVEVNQRVRENGIYPTTSRVFIGREDSTQGRFFSGLIDEPTIYSRALTGAEILAIYNAGSNGKQTPIPQPTIFVEAGTVNQTLALDSVTFVRGPFPILTDHNFSSDHHTRVILFTTNLGVTQPDPAQLTVQAAGVTLTIENVGPATGFTGLDSSYIVVRLPDGLSAGDLPLLITLRGVHSSNSPTISISP